MKRDLIPFLEFLKIADDPGTETRRHLLDQYYTKLSERGMLIGIGIQLINSYIFFDESRKLSKNALQNVNNIIGHLISTFPEKYSGWKKMIPEILKISEDLFEYSSKNELVSEIAWLFTGKLFRLKKTRV